ncbi:hypothetical protein Tco_1182945 [Tanacetum coccineum]
MALALAEERFLKLKQILEEGLNQPEKIQELMLKLLNDLNFFNGIQLKKEKQAAKICTPYWKCPIFYDGDDDDEEKSDEENESSVEDLNLTPSESEDLSDIEISSSKFDSLLEVFFGELAHIDLISPKIDEADFDPEEEIRLVEKLLYDNSSPRPPEELNSENSNAIIESFSPSPIPVEDRDILFLKELLSNDSLSLPENESFHFDRYYGPSSPLPPAKPPDDDGIHFDIDPDTEILTAKVVNDIFEHCVLMPSILPTHPTRCPVIDTLLPFSSENENKVFNSGILASNEEKSPHLLSHRGFKAFQIIFDFFESPMMIYGGGSPILDVLFLHFYPP